MQPIDIYELFLTKLNKNDTNTNVRVPIGLFVILFNEQKRQWLDDKAKGKENSDYIEDIEELLEVDILLTKIGTSIRKDDFQLPSNFFRRVSSYSLASKGECTNKMIYNWPAKPKDLNLLLQNDDYNPNFEWEETIYLLNNDKLSVYKSDFTINEVYFTYYREPRDLDIAGYTYPDGTKSQDVMIDLSKLNIEEIVNRTVLEAARNYESPEQMQLAMQRVQQNETI